MVPTPCGKGLQVSMTHQKSRAWKQACPLQGTCSGAQGKGQYVRSKSLLKYVTSVAECGKNYLVILSSNFLEHIIRAVPAIAGCLYCAACWLCAFG